MSSFQGLLIREVPAVLFIDYIPYTTRVYFDKGGERHIREILRGGGGNMKTRVAVYEEGLSDLHGEGGNHFKGGKCPPPTSENLATILTVLHVYTWKADGRGFEFHPRQPIFL